MKNPKDAKITTSLPYHNDSLCPWGSFKHRSASQESELCTYKQLKQGDVIIYPFQS